MEQSPNRQKRIMRSLFDVEEEKVGQESEEDLSSLQNLSQAVLWSTDWTTETIINQLQKGNIDLLPSFQRRDAWGADRKSSFIESVMLGLPIPQIILAEHKDRRGSFIVIDGKQRLLSIRQFSTTRIDDEFSPLPLKSLKILKELNGKTYQDISADFEYSNYITTFENQSIRTVIIRNWPDQNFLYTVFLRLNTGSLPLSPQELRQALNPGPFTTFADDFSVNSIEIKSALGIDKPDYRMRDVEIVIRYFAFKNFIEDYRGNLKEFLDNTCSQLNVFWEEGELIIREQAEELNKAISVTFQIFGENAFSKYSNENYTGIFNRPVFDIMVYYFSMPEIRQECLDKGQEIAATFESLCKNDIGFLRSLENSTKNIEPTIKRYSEWGFALKRILNKEFEVPQKSEEGNGIILR